MSTYLGTIFKIHLISYAFMGMRLLFATIFIVQIIWMKGGYSSTTFKILKKTLIVKMISKSQKYFYLVFVSVMMHQIQVFSKLSYKTYWLLKDPDTSLTNFWVVLKDLHFWINMLTLLSPIMVHTRFNDNRLLVTFFIIAIIFLFLSVFTLCCFSSNVFITSC